MNWYFAVLKNYAGFSGRARRKEYWMFFLFNIIFAVVAVILDKIFGTVIEGVGYGLFYILYVLVVFIPGLAVSVRRLHDIGKSGLMILITAIPLIGTVWFLVLMVLDSVPGENQYGPNPKEVIVSHNNIKSVVKMEERFTKRIDFQIFTGIIGLGLVLILLKSFVSKESSPYKDIDYDKILMECAKVINKDCPIMINQEMRLNNVMAEPGKEVLYNITLLNYDKVLFEKDADKYITVEELRNTNEPIIINMAKTSPIVKSFRDNKVTMVYHYSDKKGVFLFEIVVSPDQYLMASQDVDENVYKTITIGTQIWMSENLKTTKYNDDTPIPLVTDPTSWINLSTPAYSWCDSDSTTWDDILSPDYTWRKNDVTNYINTYGILYNWYAVNTGKLCPIGWHVPSDTEWNLLTDYLGGEDVAGTKLKESGTVNWSIPNKEATNETSFTALPGGYRSEYDGTFKGIGIYSYWWSSTESSEGVTRWYIFYEHSSLYNSKYIKTSGYSVRCVRDY